MGMTNSREDKGGTAARITLDCLQEQVQCIGDSCPLEGETMWERSQIKIVSVEIVNSAFGRTTNLGGLERRLNDPGDTRRHLVLKLENLFERTVEAVGPEMRAGAGIDQLGSDPDAPRCFADRAFEDIADAKLAAELFHIDHLAL